MTALSCSSNSTPHIVNANKPYQSEKLLIEHQHLQAKTAALMKDMQTTQDRFQQELMAEIETREVLQE